MQRNYMPPAQTAGKRVAIAWLAKKMASFLSQLAMQKPGENSFNNVNRIV